MSFNRPIYDNSTYKQNLSSSTYPGKYQINSPRSSGCYQTNPQIINQHMAQVKYNITDVESELYGLGKQRGQETFSKSITMKLPECHFEVQNTLLDNPKGTLRGTGWDRFDILHMNPQANIFFPGSQLQDTRHIGR